jgi:hypothetical protein
VSSTRAQFPPERTSQTENLVYDIRAIHHDGHIGRRVKGNSVLVWHIAGQVVEINRGLENVVLTASAARS